MKRSNVFFSAALAATLLLSASSCGRSDEKSEGPAEKAGARMGRAIDQTVEKAGPAMERAGEALKEAGEKAKKEISQAFNKIKDGVKKTADKTQDEKN
jgi:hypothetical protein